MGKRIPFLLFLLLIPSLFLNFYFARQLRTTTEGIQVLGIIDGDTLVLDGKTRLRLRSIDAPELDFCGGQEAKEVLENLVEGKKVVVKEQIIDTFGRPMGLVYVDGVLVNNEVLKTGWAKYHSDTTSAKDLLKETYDQAKEASLGIFSPECHQKVNPDNPKCNLKGNYDADSNRNIYYFPGCAQYEFTIVEKDEGEKWFCSEKEALAAGYLRSKTCPQK